MPPSWVAPITTASALIVAYYIIKILRAGLHRVSVKNKVVLITGASSGLGEACAKTFYEAGAKVILAARRTQELQRVKNLLMENPSPDCHEPQILELDVTDFSQLGLKVEQVMAMHGNIDILINNAGVSYRGEITSTDVSVDEKVMAVNYFGQVALTKALLPFILHQKSYRHIIMVNSLQGKISIPFRSAYSASKHALTAFTDCLRSEMAEHGILVSSINPGYIATSLSLNAVTGDGSTYGVMDATTAGGMSPEYVAARIVKQVESGRSGECTLASPFHKAAIYLRTLAPNLYFSIMNRRAKKQRPKVE